MRDKFCFWLLKLIRMGELRLTRRRMNKQRQVLQDMFCFNVGTSSRVRKFVIAEIDKDLADLTEELEIWKIAKNFERLTELDMERATRKVDEYFDATMREVDDFLVESASVLGKVGFTEEDTERAMVLLNQWEHGRR